MDADFLIQLGGGLIAAVADVAIELSAVVPDTPSPLPHSDDLITLGISALPLAIGMATKNKGAKRVGEGMLMYAAPNALKETIVRAVEVPLGLRRDLTLIRTTGMMVPTRPGLTERIRYAPEQRIITAPKFIPGVLRPRYGLGA